MVTAEELIERLKSVPPETRILTSGYEGGFRDGEFGEVCVFAQDVNTEWYYGKHEEVTSYQSWDGYKRFIGVCL